MVGDTPTAGARRWSPDRSPQPEDRRPAARSSAGGRPDASVLIYVRIRAPGKELLAWAKTRAELAPDKPFVAVPAARYRSPARIGAFRSRLVPSAAPCKLCVTCSRRPTGNDPAGRDRYMPLALQGSCCGCCRKARCGSVGATQSISPDACDIRHPPRPGRACAGHRSVSRGSDGRPPWGVPGGFRLAERREDIPLLPLPISAQARRNDTENPFRRRGLDAMAPQCAPWPGNVPASRPAGTVGGAGHYRGDPGFPGPGVCARTPAPPFRSRRRGRRSSVTTPYAFEDHGGNVTQASLSPNATAPSSAVVAVASP